MCVCVCVCVWGGGGEREREQVETRTVVAGWIADKQVERAILNLEHDSYKTTDRGPVRRLNSICLGIRGDDLNSIVRLILSTDDTAFQSMRCRLNSAYKFSKPGKVKQLRLGNWRGRKSEGEAL